MPVLNRVLLAILYGIGAGLAVFLVLLIISALLPGVTIDASAWAVFVGLIVAIAHFIRGRPTTAV